MYDSNGSPIIRFQDRDLREVFGSLSSKGRKQHHRNYLDYLDKKRLIPLIDSVWINDPLYVQHQRLRTEHRCKIMKGKILMNLVRASLLYFQYPQRQSYNYEGLIKAQILIMRTVLFRTVLALRHNGYHDEDVVEIRLSKPVLNMMSQRLANILEQPVFELRPYFLKAIEIDKQIEAGTYKK